MEDSALVYPGFDPGLQLVEKDDGMYLEIALNPEWAEQASRRLVTTDLLGQTEVPGLPYVRPDGSPFRLDTDYFGKPKNGTNPFPGPFARPESGKQVLKVWPVSSAESR
jgi:hypothetical protein